MLRKHGDQTMAAADHLAARMAVRRSLELAPQLHGEGRDQRPVCIIADLILLQAPGVELLSFGRNSLAAPGRAG